MSARCHHCNAPSVHASALWQHEGRGLCGICKGSPNGVCRVCKDDVLEPRYCWSTQQELDKAVVKVGFDSDSCRECGRAMEIHQVGANGFILRCPGCGLKLTVTWTKPRKRNPDGRFGNDREERGTP